MSELSKEQRDTLMNEACDKMDELRQRIAALEVERARLREALRPFSIDIQEGETNVTNLISHISLSDFRRAHAARKGM